MTTRNCLIFWRLVINLDRSSFLPLYATEDWTISTHLSLLVQCHNVYLSLGPEKNICHLIFSSLMNFSRSCYGCLIPTAYLCLICLAQTHRIVNRMNFSKYTEVEIIGFCWVKFVLEIPPILFKMQIL